jgi:hypothetical protein
MTGSAVMRAYQKTPSPNRLAIRNCAQTRGERPMPLNSAQIAASSSVHRRTRVSGYSPQVVVGIDCSTPDCQAIHSAGAMQYFD